jgi:hypothetical protein
MLSAPENMQHDPHDVLEISPDVVLVARAAADFPTLAPDATGHDVHMGATAAATPRLDTPRLDTTFRAADTSGERASHGKWLRSAAMAFLFALVSAFGAAAWERYGDDAQAMFASFSPQSTLASWIPTSLPSWLMPGRAAVAAQSDSPAAQPAAADQSAQPAAPQATDSAAAAPTPPSDPAQLMQSMARDVASLNQQIGELKARIAELKAGQEQVSQQLGQQLGRDTAKAPEARMSEAKPVEPRPTKLGAPPRPLGTLVTPAPVHRPKPPTYPPAQAAYVPPPPPIGAAPVQIAPAPPPGAARDEAPVVRPPMPLQQ